MIQRKVFKWIGVICIGIVILACIIYVQNVLSVPPSNTEPTVAADWDVCRLGSGLVDNTEVELTTEEENALGSLIFNYPLRQTTQEELSKNKPGYGGPFYSVIFLKDNVMHHWTFSSGSITYFTVDHGIASEWFYYEGDYELLSLIGNFNDISPLMS